MRLADLPPLRLIMPAPENARRPVLDAYMATHGITVDRIMELDAMMATFDLVTHSEWATILPLTACIDELRTEAGDDNRLWFNPIVGPEIASDFMLIHPASLPLSTAARHFVDAFEAELRHCTGMWARLVAA